jgi:nucleoside-triphosphatase
LSDMFLPSSRDIILARFFIENLTGPQLFLLTGGRRTGKTTLCLDLVQQARAHQVKAAGLISPGHYEGGNRTGIYLQDVESGEQRLLATESKQQSEGASQQKISTGCWGFSTEVLDWGNLCLQRYSDGCELLILDELGPLEFKRGQGLVAGLALLDSRRYKQAVAVVRPELLEMARSRWPWSTVLEITLEGER